MNQQFFNLYTHDFARVAAAVPVCKVADPVFNAAQTIALATEAAQNGVVVLAFPELGLTAYTCDDLFHQRALLDASLDALATINEACASLPLALVVGMPLLVDNQLFNCAVVLAGGEVLGVVPKTYLPNYGEFYEARQFSAGDNASSSEIMLLGQQVPFGSGLLFEVSNLPLLKFHVEICEDLWSTVPPSSFAALAGATVLLNLSASNTLVGKAGYRHALVQQQSARCLSAYLYSSSGNGESTTDMAWDGQALIYENGELLSQSKRFFDGAQLVRADLDLGRLSHERMRTTTFGHSVRRHAQEVGKFRTVSFALEIPDDAILPLERRLERFPYVPSDRQRRDERCAEVYNIQVQALVQRLSSSGIGKLVIGISGGLDSTHALLVCARAMDKLGLPRTNILGITMPGFATSERTLRQARQLMALVGCSAQEIDIRPSCQQMLRDIGHPYAEGQEQYDITFENVQAGERTSHLFRIANFRNGVVIGTGDLSELALGWCTYGVGDHMSHYNVNASVPKTLITHLVRWVAESGALHDGKHDADEVLLNIVNTDISPELVPARIASGVSSAPEQKTESVIGPYELQDFHLYYTLRFGFTPAKVAFLAHAAWADREAGDWPEGDHVARNEYDIAAIKRYLGIFLFRFFQTSQFKRSCVPNSPKVGSGGSLSPRGDWRAPSDASATVWMKRLQDVPDHGPDSAA